MYFAFTRHLRQNYSYWPLWGPTIVQCIAHSPHLCNLSHQRGADFPGHRSCHDWAKLPPPCHGSCYTYHTCCITRECWHHAKTRSPAGSYHCRSQCMTFGLCTRSLISACTVGETSREENAPLLLSYPDCEKRLLRRGGPAAAAAAVASAAAPRRCLRLRCLGHFLSSRRTAQLDESDYSRTIRERDGPSTADRELVGTSHYRPAPQPGSAWPVGERQHGFLELFTVAVTVLLPLICPSIPLSPSLVVFFESTAMRRQRRRATALGRGRIGRTTPTATTALSKKRRQRWHLGAGVTGAIDDSDAAIPTGLGGRDSQRTPWFTGVISCLALPPIE